MTRGNHHNAIRVLADDYRAMETVFEELESRQGPPEQRKDLADHALSEAVRQWTAEERYVYPEVRRHVPDGGALVRHEIDEHHRIDGLMLDLEAFGPDHPHFEQKLHQFIEDYRHAVRNEQHELVPALQESCSEATLDELGDKLLRAKETAPTRPHPLASQTLPAERALMPGAGFINRIRDSIRP